MEGIARAVRALVEVGDPLLVLARESVRPDPAQFERGLAAPLRQLLERGQSAGAVRADVPSTLLVAALVGLLGSVVPSSPVLGREDTIETITKLFLDGVRARS